jgi:hypothetical protein
MSNFAPWEIEENKRWMVDVLEADQETPPAPVILSAQDAFKPAAVVPDGRDTIRIAENIATGLEMREDSIPDIEPMTELELKRTGKLDSYVKFYKLVRRVCRELEDHLNSLNSPIFHGCPLQSLPEKYRDISTEMEDNWRRRKESQSAVPKAIFLATELIKVFPIYRFFLPLEKPLRLIDCMRDRLDASQLSLVLDEINKLPAAPYEAPSFLSMKCHACDRLISLYIRAKAPDKAIEACDCGSTLEGTAKNPGRRFRRIKKAILKGQEKKRNMLNSWDFDYDAQFKRSISHRDLSDSALH